MDIIVQTKRAGVGMGTERLASINNYGRNLTDSEIEAGMHRGYVGGMWEELGQLQIDYLKQQGLQPHHAFLDIGCGALRGGIHFIAYLNPGMYCGLDINPSLLKAGQHELKLHHLEEKSPHLLQSDLFEINRFNRKFDYMLALSVFTHLPFNHILRCLQQVAGSLNPGGRFYATYFEAPSPVYLQPFKHEPGSVTTQFDLDPYHCHFSELKHLASQVGLAAERIGEWNHPRAQKLALFQLA